MLQDALKNLRYEAEWVGLREVKETTRSCMARNGKVEKNITGIDQGCMVEVLVDGQFAYCAVPSLSPEALQYACDRATALARHTAACKTFEADVTHRPAAQGQYKTHTQHPLDKAVAGDVMAVLIEMTNTMKVSDRIVNTMAQAMLIDHETRLVSTAGADIHQHSSCVSYTLRATAQDGPEIQNRSTTPCHQGGLEILNTDVLTQEAHRISQEALELLGAEPCPTGVYDLILHPDQLYLQIHESIGHPLELDRILGDERNYAGWSFVKPSDFGQLQYGSPLLNILFDPDEKGGYASYAFDDAGVATSRQYIIKDGVLLRGIGGIDSQKRSGLLGVSSQRASSWNRPPIDRMANINMAPGTSSFEDMISGVKRGIYMMTNTSWSIDDYRNKFQFGCEYAKLIENGKITKTLKNPNYRGISTPFWNSLTKVGDPTTFKPWGSTYCGKGEPNQIIRVGHSTPTCLFENVDVFGGAS